MAEYLFHSDETASDSRIESSHAAGISQRLRHVAFGELLGTAVAVGAVAVGRNFPAGIKATKKLDGFFAEHLADLFNVTSESGLRELGRKSTNTALIQLGGMTNVATQYKLLRASHESSDERPFYVDVAQVGLGRIISSIGAASMVGAGEFCAPATLRKVESGLDRAINVMRDNQAIAKGVFNVSPGNPLSEILVNNVLQSMGGIPCNAVTQHLFDRLVGQGYSASK